uniref:Methyltransferase type 12 domain-containing protein n=1 Tax=Clastoptera arizonana TaxID=38151 RepID=A0A1B6D3P8_9HEMI
MFSDPDFYKKANLFTTVNTKDVLEKFQKFIKFQEDEMNLILDVGSGCGSVTSNILIPAISPHNFKLIGIDINSTSVDFANTHVKDARASFRVLDITEKDKNNFKKIFSEDELNPGFDVVYSFSVLNWAGDIEQVLNNLYSLLKPGGQILLWFMGYSDLTGIWRSVKENQKWNTYLKMEPDCQFIFHDSSDVIMDCSKIVSSAGFQDIIVDCNRMPVVTDWNYNWRNPMEMIAPWRDKIPEHLQKEYFDDIYNGFKERENDPDNLQFDRIVIIATKPHLS